jgi:L-asparaginase/Glu-tRNA(Gln) amidotransferase subunit D
MKIKVLMTGGTIDKVYNTSTGELTFVKTHIIDIKNRQVGEKWVSDDYSYLCKGL